MNTIQSTTSQANVEAHNPADSCPAASCNGIEPSQAALLYSQHLPSAKKLARSKGSRRPDETGHDALVSALSRFIPTMLPFEIWLALIVGWKVKEEFRKFKTREALHDPFVPEFHELPGSVADGVDKGLWQDLTAALSQLPSFDREILLAHDYKGYSIQQIIRLPAFEYRSLTRHYVLEKLERARAAMRAHMEGRSFSQIAALASSTSGGCRSMGCSECFTSAVTFSA